MAGVLAPGWYQDPEDHSRSAYWTGREWLRPSPPAPLWKAGVVILLWVASMVAAMLILAQLMHDGAGSR